jgi:DNA invertase Pin-like site-specific DNA recombinase
MKYGYARVSSDDQNSSLQLAALKKAGAKRIYTDDGISGATTRRAALLRCLKTLKAGDTLTVRKLDRLGRSLRDLIIMLDDLKARGVNFHSLTEHIDKETPTGRAVWKMIGVLAELERSLIAGRTRAGVTAASARGVKFGRKAKLTPPQLSQARTLLAQGEQPEDVAESFHVGRSTLYRALAA